MLSATVQVGVGPGAGPESFGGGRCDGRLALGVDPVMLAWAAVGQGPVFISGSLALEFLSL